MSSAKVFTFAISAIVFGSLVDVSSTHAITLPGQRHHAEGTAVEIGTTGVFQYSFEVFNDSIGGGPSEDEIDGDLVIIDWELPIWDPALIREISDPSGWGHEVILNTDSRFPSIWQWQAAGDPLLQNDPLLYGPDPTVYENPTAVIHWFADLFEVPEDPTTGNVIFPWDSLTGFGFKSDFDDTNAPDTASWAFLPITQGDPPIPQGLGLPNTPNNPAFGATNIIPEPTTAALGLLGIAGLLARRRRAA